MNLSLCVFLCVTVRVHVRVCLKITQMHGCVKEKHQRERLFDEKELVKHLCFLSITPVMIHPVSMAAHVYLQHVLRLHTGCLWVVVWVKAPVICERPCYLSLKVSSSLPHAVETLVTITTCY